MKFFFVYLLLGLTICKVDIRQIFEPSEGVFDSISGVLCAAVVVTLWPAVLLLRMLRWARRTL